MPAKNADPQPRAKEPRTPLTRERIVSAALAIVDREGLSALSMRRLGAELGVDPMAAYYYVPNKDALLDAIVEAVMAEIDLSIDDRSASTEARLVRAACVYRDVMLAHANALPILLSRGPRTRAAMRPVELVVGILRDAGLSPAQAMAGMNAFAAQVRGIVSMLADDEGDPPSQAELDAMAAVFPESEFPHLREAVNDPDFCGVDFEFGIRSLARGLAGTARQA